MFTPYPGYVEIEPLSQSELASDSKEFIAVGKVIETPNTTPFDSTGMIRKDEIIFFRPHGMFETPEHEGKKHYVVRVSEEFILGKYGN